MMKFFGLQKLIIPPAASETGNIKLHNKNIAFTIVRSARRKRTVAFAIDTGAHLRVMAPLRTRLPVIEAMLKNRSAWILNKIAEHEEFQKRKRPQRFAEAESISYMGHNYRLEITQDVHATQGCRLKPRCLTVNIADTELSAEALQQEVRLEILLWMKKRARDKFKKRMDLWAGKLGVTYKKLIVTDPARQWGSCNGDNVIRLNWRLIMAPLPLIDYVAAHELAHVVHKNHSPRFWKFLAREMPDYKFHRRQLQQTGNRLVL